MYLVNMQCLNAILKVEALFLWHVYSNIPMSRLNVFTSCLTTTEIETAC